MMITPQQVVYGHVEARGYTKGWTPEQFLVRNLFKIMEEVAEVTNHLSAQYYPAEDAIASAGARCREIFKEMPRDQEVWINNTDDYEHLKKELADVQVVLYCMASALEQITGKPFDLDLEAVRKASSDVSRGVR
jgi:NTP pyrophosphatase (non-canonical NTP hydrolase)